MPRQTLSFTFDASNHPVNAFAIQADDGKWVIVDAPGKVGVPDADFADEMVEQLALHHVPLESISLILITHGHPDHYCAAAALRNRHHVLAPVMIHEADAGYAREGKPAPVVPVAEGPLAGIAKQVAERLGGITGFTPCVPDIVLQGEENHSLAAYGLPEVYVVYTPGHTAGSVSVVLDDTAIIGDLLFGKGGLGGNQIDPMFHIFLQEPAKARTSVQKLLDAGVKTLMGGHGGPWTAQSVRALLTETQ
eukprot:TRINITY_DN275_c0_g1_i1.p1 TRINITY_DN275_c0_g1~~TRINITY_DN275_c0_g1_i1.p1  ORF type:complete len:249 (+),score=34.73 TRINITY_DN275_c0_g1_i1:109-855(+)